MFFLYMHCGGQFVIIKLFFGCGAWELLPTNLQKRLDHVVVKLYREAPDLQYWRETGLSDEYVMAKHCLVISSILLDGPSFLWGRLMHLKDVRRLDFQVE